LQHDCELPGHPGLAHHQSSRKDAGAMRFAPHFRDARGATLVEFALASTLFFTITFGTIEFGRMILDYNIVSNAAREGVRYASVRGAASGRTASASDVQTYVVSRSVGLLSASDVTVTWPTNKAVGSIVQVQVTYSFTPIVTLLPQTAVSLSSTTKAYILR
ncbi:MAG TPA: TadE/TadG family type IV pilus assembly protein, partial [Vicinamibacterales bacterium]|nr:TadE/TadG family type IV pilus assembly protein [Vicinamibacterales bacterium]